MRPTQEQSRAVDLFLTGDDLKINAFAGAGKSSTLRFMAQATERRGVYFAFNASIASEARGTFPPTVSTHTLHSYAFHQVAPAYRAHAGKLTGSVSASSVQETLQLASRGLAAATLATVHRFCQSGSCRLGRTHVARSTRGPGVSWWRSYGYAARVLRHAGRLWEHMTDPQSPVPLGHDGYLKLWALSHPVIPANFILLDEAQDSSGVVVDLLRRQSCQVVYVGDRYQQIYAWRGAVNAMDRVRTRHTTHLTQSFRFGPAIAEAASRILRVLGERNRIRGNPVITSVLGCDTPQAILCRSNATVLETATRHLDHRRVAVLGGTRELERLVADVERLQQGRRSLDPLLWGYRSWPEVVRASQASDVPELRSLVKPVLRHGLNALKRCLASLTPDEAHADLVVTTVHKAKGREWERVAVADDFRPFRYRRGGVRVLDREDIRLVYVAATRGREAVDLPRRLRSEFGIV